MVYLPLVAADGRVAWVVLGDLYSMSLDSSYGSTVGGGAVCFLCSGHGDVDSLVPLTFWCIFPLSLLMVELIGLELEVSHLCP